MKRWIWRALVFLLIGAVINVAVAWGCTLWSRPVSERDKHVQGNGWPASAPPDWPSPTLFYRHRGIGIRSEDAHAGLEAIAETRRQDPSVTWYSMIVDRYGFPLPALQAARAKTQVMRTITPIRLGTISEGLLIPMQLRPANMRERNLPLKPVWGGFAVNSAAYGGGSWLALLLIQRWRRAAREKRGLCAVCGYPAGASSVCTECGKPVKARAVPAEAIAIAQPRL